MTNPPGRDLVKKGGPAVKSSEEGPESSQGLGGTIGRSLYVTTSSRLCSGCEWKRSRFGWAGRSRRGGVSHQSSAAVVPALE